jgi:hypothetical protein
MHCAEENLHKAALYNLAYQNMLSRPEIGELTGALV